MSNIPLKNTGILLTCEHAVNRVPHKYSHLFVSKKNVLSTHKGYDIGALAVARALASRLRVPLFSGTVSRLVVDLNRSPSNHKLFSSFTRTLDKREIMAILATYYDPFHRKIRNALNTLLNKNKMVVHFSVHSFTPILNGTIRNAEIGLLYDPSRGREKKLSKEIAAELSALLPDLRIRYNYPYRGTSDGTTTGLRKKYPASRYVGIEIEINQKLLRPRSATAHKIRNLLPEAVARSLPCL